MQYDGQAYWATRINTTGGLVYRNRIASGSLPRWSVCATSLPNGNIVTMAGDFDSNPPTSTNYDLVQIYAGNGSATVSQPKLIRPCPVPMRTPSNDAIYLGGMSTNNAKYDPTIAMYNLSTGAIVWSFQLHVRSVIDSAYSNHNLFADVVGELSDGSFLVGVTDEGNYPVLLTRVDLNVGGSPTVMWSTKPVRITNNNWALHNCHVQEDHDAFFCGYWSVYIPFPFFWEFLGLFSIFLCSQQVLAFLGSTSRTARGCGRRASTLTTTPGGAASFVQMLPLWGWVGDPVRSRFTSWI